MSPVTHLLAGWLLANTSKNLSRKERAFITLAGVVPDLDGLGLIAELATRNTDHPLLWWTEYHHVLGHNVLCSLIAALLCAFFAKRRMLTFLLVIASFNLHVFCDLIGARGPDGDQWAIYYFYPFSDYALTWSGQWELNAWQNFVITIGALLLTFRIAYKRGFSPIEIISQKADAIFVQTVRKRFGTH